MRNRVFAGVAILSVLAGPMSAQKRGDQATLVFTVSGAYIDGQGLWSVPAQPIQDGAFSDTYNLNRSVKSTFGASLSGTYYPHSKLGLTAEAFLVGLGYDDGCRLVTPSQSAIQRRNLPEHRPTGEIGGGGGGIDRRHLQDCESRDHLTICHG